MNADALASGASSVPSRCCAMVVPATRTAGSTAVRLSVNRTSSARAWPIHPTDVTTCSHTVACRHRCPGRFAIWSTVVRQAPQGNPGSPGESP
ncbi:hypothetical protein AIIKEEIJ_01741 [Rhodococcus sp. YH1]|nr:hypothetical protein [Rhodococcus sp. YH1]